VAQAYLPVVVAAAQVNLPVAVVPIAALREPACQSAKERL